MTAAHPSGPPTTVQLGPYLLTGRIGAGAMGEVHRAVDTAHDGRVVALKLLPAAVAQDPQRRARFERESHIVASLTEPHVIDVHSYGEIDGRLYLGMQLVDGPDLAAHLVAGGPLPPEHAVAVVEQVAAALDAAHAAGLVHHDVKPSNVLLHRPAPGRVPRVVLADFGIAGDAGGFGTAEYLAPERWQERAGDRRVDVYALACVLHELLTGARAFPGSEFAAQMHGHLRLPPPRPSAMRTGIPAALDAVVAAGMAKDPEQRVPTAGRLAAMARAAVAPARRGVSRRSLLVGAAAGIGTLGAGIAIASAVRAGGGPVLGGSPPARITPDRALGIGSFEWNPFALGAVGGTAYAVLVEASSVDDPKVRVWDLLADRQAGPDRPGGVSGLAYLSKQVAIADVAGRGLLCSVNNSALNKRPFVSTDDLLTAGSPSQVPLPNPVAVTFSAVDGALLALGEDGVVSRIDLATRAVTATSAPVPGAGILYDLQVAEVDGSTAALVRSAGGSLVALDAATLAPLATWDWSADSVVTVGGRTYGVGTGSKIGISPPGERPRTIDSPPASAVAATEVDVRGVAAVGLRSGDIVLLDVVTGTWLRAVLSGHETRITQLGVVRSGERPLLVSAAADNTVRVWDLAVHAAAG